MKYIYYENWNLLICRSSFHHFYPTRGIWAAYEF